MASVQDEQAAIMTLESFLSEEEVVSVPQKRPWKKWHMAVGVIAVCVLGVAAVTAISPGNAVADTLRASPEHSVMFDEVDDEETDRIDDSDVNEDEEEEDAGDVESRDLKKSERRRRNIVKQWKYAFKAAPKLFKKKKSPSYLSPECDLAKFKTVDDINNCCISILKMAKEAGSFQSNLAKSLASGSPLSPGDTQRKIEEDFTQDKYFSELLLGRMNNQTAQLTKMMNKLMAQNKRKMDKQTAALHAKVQASTKATTSCVHNGMSCNKKCLEAHKGDFLEMAPCSMKCTTTHTACLNKVNIPS